MNNIFTIHYRTIVIVALAGCVVLLGMHASNTQKEVASLESAQDQVSVLLAGEQPAPGFTCGVLTTQKAQDILDSTVEREFSQGPTNTINLDKPAQQNTFWSDSCRYRDMANHNRYVEFYMYTFQSNEDAEQAFPDFLQLVHENKVLASEEFGSKLVYDAGVFNLLRENKIIQVAASNGESDNLQAFSRATFESLLMSIE